MKNNIYSLTALIIFCVNASFGQVTTYLNGDGGPTPDPDLPLTIWIDLSLDTDTRSVGLDGDVYIWTWIDGCDKCIPKPNADAIIGTWPASAATAKMTLDISKGPRVYKYTYGPTLKDYFGTTTENLWGKKLGCLAKNSSGALQTADFLTTIPAPIIGKQLLGTFPVKWLNDTVLVDRNDVVTFVYNKSLDTLAQMNNPANPVGPNDICVFTRAYFNDGTFVNYHASGAAYDTYPSLTMKYINDGEYRLSFIPNQFFKASEGCTNAAAIEAKLATGLYISKITMRVYRTRASAGTLNPVPGPTTPGKVGYEILFPKP